MYVNYCGLFITLHILCALGPTISTQNEYAPRNSYIGEQASNFYADPANQNACLET